LTPRVAAISGRIGTMMISWLLAENIISQSAKMIRYGFDVFVSGTNRENE
jgi:hypothetical protein